MFCLFSEKYYSGESVLIQGVECEIINVHLHNDLVSGPVTVGVRTSSPIEGVHCLLGNYLVGRKAVLVLVLLINPREKRS